MNDAFFTTSQLNYKLLAPEFLKEIKNFTKTLSKDSVTTSKTMSSSYIAVDRNGSPLQYLDKHFNTPNTFRPYLNLIKPIKNFFYEKDIVPMTYGVCKINPNVSNFIGNRASYRVRAVGAASGLTTPDSTPCAIWIPLEDYSRSNKIFQRYIESELVGEVAANTSIIFNNHSKYQKKIVNTTNQAYQFLVIYADDYYNVTNKIQ